MMFTGKWEIFRIATGEMPLIMNLLSESPLICKKQIILMTMTVTTVITKKKT